MIANLFINNQYLKFFGIRRKMCQYVECRMDLGCDIPSSNSVGFGSGHTVH